MVRDLPGSHSNSGAGPGSEGGKGASWEPHAGGGGDILPTPRLEDSVGRKILYPMAGWYTGVRKEGCKIWGLTRAGFKSQLSY